MTRMPISYKYKLDPIDIDECAFGKICPNNAICRNSPGSFSCECSAGFTLISHIFQTCVDINECEASNPCEHECINTYGSFQCTCREGYTLAADKRRCVDIDECSLTPKLCSGSCTNLPGSYRCACEPGFILDRYKSKTCEGKRDTHRKMHLFSKGRAGIKKNLGFRY